MNACIGVSQWRLLSIMMKRKDFSCRPEKLFRCSAFSYFYGTFNVYLQFHISGIKTRNRHAFTNVAVSHYGQFSPAVVWLFFCQKFKEKFIQIWLFIIIYSPSPKVSIITQRVLTKNPQKTVKILRVWRRNVGDISNGDICEISHCKNNNFKFSSQKR